LSNEKEKNIDEITINPLIISPRN